MSGDFPVQLATRLHLIGPLRCRVSTIMRYTNSYYIIHCWPFVRVFGVVLHSPRARLVADILASMSRGCYEENCFRGI